MDFAQVTDAILKAGPLLAGIASVIAAIRAGHKADNAGIVAVAASKENKDAISKVDAKVDTVVTVASDVQTQVTTLNEKSLANLADDVESRRIKDIPEGERTTIEQDHVDLADTQPDQTKENTKLAQEAAARGEPPPQKSVEPAVPDKPKPKRRS